MEVTTFPSVIALALMAGVLTPPAKPHTVCGVRFYAANWRVQVKRSSKKNCAITVFPRDLQKILQAEAIDGKVADRYTIEVDVTPRPPEPDEGEEAAALPKFRSRDERGWHIAEDDEHYGRMYFEGDGYCCLSYMPVAVVSQPGITVTVTGSAAGEDIYREIVRTLKVAPVPPN